MRVLAQFGQGAIQTGTRQLSVQKLCGIEIGFQWHIPSSSTDSRLSTRGKRFIEEINIPPAAMVPATNVVMKDGRGWNTGQEAVASVI